MRMVIFLPSTKELGERGGQRGYLTRIFLDYHPIFYPTNYLFDWLVLVAEI